MSLLNKAYTLYKEKGIFELIRSSVKHFTYLSYRISRKFHLLYYQFRGKVFFSIRNVRFAMYVNEYDDAREFFYLTRTEYYIIEEIINDLKAL